MDVVALSRLQFALTSMFHWIFVPLTLGLSLMTAYMETRYVKTGDEMYLRMTKFWGKLFLINFALGVVTGITMEFQFGMNWAEYSKYVGDIFGAPLAIEATMAFFLESVFIGVWIFGWNKISKKAHATSIWLVSLATNLSALWILLANGWMQHPVGYVLRNNRAEMVDFGALLTNPYGWLKFGHTLTSGYVVAAFFVMGVSAYHLLKKNQSEFFQRSFKIAAVFGLASTLAVAVIGDFHAVEVARTQPTKFAAMESLWDTQKNVGYNLFIIPDTDKECNVLEGPCMPNLLSYLAFHTADAEIKGLKAFPQGRSPAGTAHVLELPDHAHARLYHALSDDHGGHLRKTRDPRNASAIPDDHALLHPPALYCRPARLDRGGGGQAALDRLRGPEDHPCRIAVHQHAAGVRLSARIHPALRRARRGRYLSPVQVREKGA